MVFANIEYLFLLLLLIPYIVCISFIIIITKLILCHNSENYFIKRHPHAPAL